MKLDHIAGTAFLVSMLVLSAIPSAHAAPSFDLSGLETAAANDLAAAKVDADAHGDAIASQCYGGVAQYVSAHPLSVPALNVRGVASAFQAGRDAVKLAETASAQGLMPTDLILACGPLALDVQNDLGKAAAGGISLFGLKLF